MIIWFGGLILFWAVFFDLKTRCIPNNLTYFAGIFSFILILFLPNFIFSSHLLGALICFVCFSILFFLKLMGGGDVKLLTLVGFWCSIESILPVLLLIFIFGGGQALLAKYIFKQNSIPYAVAIFLGFLSYYLLPAFLNLTFV